MGDLGYLFFERVRTSGLIFVGVFVVLRSVSGFHLWSGMMGRDLM